jgi:hypothetical protein
MVSGAVAPPRLDLANEDLVRSHVHSIWLAETGLSLGKRLPDLLDLSDVERLPLAESVKDGLGSESARSRARTGARKVLASLADEMGASEWYSTEWLDGVLLGAPRALDMACDRWRSLYRAARAQTETQNRAILDHTRSQADKKAAQRLRAEAEQQLRLLTEIESLAQSDFYSYRYFASEGFLPGYSFPRLPLAAYIPARHGAKADEFIQRPRFLAISEFGPGTLIYHEGSQYQVNRVRLPPADGDGARTRAARLCPACGYLHPITGERQPDVCERCGARLEARLDSLFRMQNVSTQRRERINSDEEERKRRGYRLVTAFRFNEREGAPSCQTALATLGELELARLTYSHAATLWRINMGWRRHSDGAPPGFLLDLERGYWAKQKSPTKDGAPDDGPDDTPESANTAMVIPFVEDTRNCLLMEPGQTPSREWAVSMQAALKSAIEVEFQLEDSELACELLPSEASPRLILFYEAAEGGAGVLRRLVEDPHALARVCRTALELCHFDPDTGADRHRAPRAVQDCGKACYDCLMSYSNQTHHHILDRRLIRDALRDLAQARVEVAPVPQTRAAHLEMLSRQAGSDLERKWLEFVAEHGYALPQGAQTLIEECGTRPDFLYKTAAVYVDGPHHAYPQRQERDRIQEAALADSGYTVARFGLEIDWDEVFRRYPWVCGAGQAATAAGAGQQGPPEDDVIWGTEDDPGGD